jgi:hypothetical protein
MGRRRKASTNEPCAGKLVAAPGFTNAPRTAKSAAAPFDRGRALNRLTSTRLGDDYTLAGTRTEWAGAWR